MSPWVYLVLAGIFEVGFTSFMKLSDGFTKGKFVVLFLISALISFVFLSQALKEIPLGTAYAIWTGIGVLGTITLGILFFKDPISTSRIVFLILLFGSIVGLKVTAGEH